MRRIAVIAPSFRPHTFEIFAGVEILERAGFEVVLGDIASSSPPDYNTPFRDYPARAKELLWALRESEAEIIWFCDGGAGASYLLPLLEKEWERYPWDTSKIFIGFSDVNYLMLYMIKLGHRCLLGPNCLVDEENSEKQLAIAADQLFNGIPDLIVETVDVLRPGKAEGFFVGGNFSVLSSISGTRFCPNLKGSVLFFEEHGPELPGQHEYLFWERMQTVQLREDWSGVAGFVVGDVQTCGPYVDREDLFPTIEDVLCSTLFSQTTGPVISKFPFGHECKRLLPIGLPVILEAEKGSCRLNFNSIKL